MKQNRRLKMLIASGFTGRPSHMFFATLTAPGADVLPWDEEVCAGRGAHVCSGKIGCRTVEIDAAVWNGSAPQAWSWFMTDLRRELDGHEVQFFKCWETQKRGVLHLHAILWCPGVTAERFAAAWVKCAGIGHQIDGYGFSWGAQLDARSIANASNLPEIAELANIPLEAVAELEPDPASEDRKRHVRYLAKYCTKGGDRATCVNRRTGEIMRDGKGYRTWSASSRFGKRMKCIRGEQRAFMAAGGPGASDGVAGPAPAPEALSILNLISTQTAEMEDRKTGSVTALV